VNHTLCFPLIYIYIYVCVCVCVYIYIKCVCVYENMILLISDLPSKLSIAFFQPHIGWDYLAVHPSTLLTPTFYSVVGSTFYSSVQLYLLFCHSTVTTKHYCNEICKWEKQTLAPAIHFSDLFLPDCQTKLIREHTG
jgi:hypothetical protein